MADELIPVGGAGHSKRLKDQGDGSVAEVVQAAVAPGLASNAIIADTSVAFANNDAAGTVKNVDIALPANRNADSLYLITVTDPSSESDLTVTVKGVATFGGTARYPTLTTFGVTKSNADGRSVLVQGWLLGEGGRLAISNDTLIGAAGAFTAYVRVRGL